jgi:hypothetical protein
MKTAKADVHSSHQNPTAATDPSGPTGRLATWLAATSIEDIPPSVREHAKYLILDGVACALAQLAQTRGVGRGKSMP